MRCGFQIIIFPRVVLAILCLIISWPVTAQHIQAEQDHPVISMDLKVLVQTVKYVDNQWHDPASL